MTLDAGYGRKGPDGFLDFFWLLWNINVFRLG
jgi:hypothetical protein